MTMHTTLLRRRRDGGQALVLMALALVGLLAMAGLIIDGGNAWSQQRLTQNGTDAASEAGAVVLARVLVETRAGITPKTDTDVHDAVATSATHNGIDVPLAYYTDYQGNLLTSDGVVTSDPGSAAKVGVVGTIPPNAQGVQAIGQKSFRTYLAGVVGINSFGAGASATTVAGGLTGVTPNSVLPVTFPVAVSTCDNTSSLKPGTSPLWPIVSKDTATPANEVIVPLCQNGPGAVGWLDFGCGTLSYQISHPCNVAFTIPDWIQTTPGNPNTVDSEMNAYHLQKIMLPLFDGTCKTAPPGTLLGDCPAGQEGVGNNTYYHIPYFVGFLLDHAYIQGNNHPECGGNGSTGCLKGWFVQLVLQGPVGQGAGTNLAGAIGIQLIK
jgi:Flp pilus assembly protein TadG